MNIWEMPKEHYNWESPITKIYGDIHNEIIRQDEENYTFAIEQAIGYKVDKEELIKALRYDREQYNKGYKDGVRETFISELENIKTEIEEIISQREIAFKESNTRTDNLKTYSYLRGITKAKEILDKHISELKGEKQCD